MKYQNYRKRRRTMPSSFAQEAIENIKRALVDSFTPAPAPACKCDDCRIARAHDITPEGQRKPELSISTGDLLSISDEAMRLNWTPAEMTAYSRSLFGKIPELLTMREAQAVLAHLRQIGRADI